MESSQNERSGESDNMKKRYWFLAAALVLLIGGAGLFLLRPLHTARALQVTELSLGEKYLADANYQKATATLQRLIRVEPSNTEAYLALSRAYRCQGDLDMAREMLEQGLRETGSSILARAAEELAGWGSETGDITGNGAAERITLAGRSYAADSRELILRDCGLTTADLALLSGFPALERLDISGNDLESLEPLTALPALKRLYAANNRITDVSPLEQLSGLEYVGLRGNRISDASPLFRLPQLQYLHLADNEIRILPRLGSELRLLYLKENPLEDVSGREAPMLLYCDVGLNIES